MDHEPNKMVDKCSIQEIQTNHWLCNSWNQKPILIHFNLILTTAVQSSYACYSCFSDEDTDSQRR